MTKKDWEINLQNAVDAVVAIHPKGKEIVKHILGNYEATSIKGLSPANYDEVFSELDFIASDLR